ncbi:MAG: CarD family transcriptional regulator [Deltaproteobacteria bacterium]
MFKVGSKAVYPAHGVVEIRAIEAKEICGTKKTFYILKVLESDVTVMVPTDNAENIGLRPIITKTEVPGIYEILKNKKTVEPVPNGNQSWNKRYREYVDKLKSGNIVEVATVLKSIYLLRGEKELSFGERRIFDNARVLLIREIALAKDSDEQSVAGEIEKLLTE